MVLEWSYWCFHKAMGDRLCDQIIDFAMTKKKQRAITIQEGWDRDSMKKPLTKKEFQKLQNQRDSFATWLNEPWIYKEIQPFVSEANKKANWNFQWDWSEEVQFTHYGKSQHYDWHNDCHTTDLTKNTRNGRIRKLSLVANLSRPKDYKGGIFQFDLNNTNARGVPIHTCEEMKERGSVIVFPSFLWHKVTPVTSGKRYSIVCWNWGNPFV
jgi:PKHD-type hydroxylase|tara:strand:+ start:480 stop:1112 length:633 start_codon:yes stop_codon:yes gene_type:complete